MKKLVLVILSIFSIIAHAQVRDERVFFRGETTLIANALFCSSKDHSMELLEAFHAGGETRFTEAFIRLANTPDDTGYPTCTVHEQPTRYVIGEVVAQMRTQRPSNYAEEMLWYIITIRLMAEPEIYYLISPVPVHEKVPPPRREEHMLAGN